ncbi:S41 family peptidase [Streptomyces sp. NPDC054863]
MRRHVRPQPYPPPAVEGPLVFLADERCGSDGDVVVEALRAMRLGPVVGTRTWGGTTTIEVGHRLAEGTRLVQPRGTHRFPGGGPDCENRGVAPDVEVSVAPHARAAGHDP